MKKRLIFICLTLLTAVSILYLRKFYFKYGEFMSVKRVCKKWGREALDIGRFKTAGEDESARAGMTCSLIRSKTRYIGKKGWEIRKIFGDYSGYYFSDMFPTYLIERAKREGQDSWQIVFLLNKAGEVSDIVVHKNCCHSWKRYLLLKLPI